MLTKSVGMIRFPVCLRHIHSSVGMVPLSYNSYSEEFHDALKSHIVRSLCLNGGFSGR